MNKMIIRGWCDIGTIYPNGNSDADTVKVKVATVSFIQDGREIDIYRQITAARSLEEKPEGEPRRQPILQAGTISVRLQGIDAPELHFQPGKGQPYFRQPRGASAARRFSQALCWSGRNWMPCELISRVQHPADAFDKYGRLVANIIDSSTGADLNLLLLQNGLVFPAIYNSMQPDEIQMVLAAAARGREANDSIWRDWSAELTFDPSLLAPEKGKPVAEPDHGQLNLPKVFRRLARHIQAGGTLSTFKASLTADAEQVLRTNDVLAGELGQPFLFSELIGGTEEAPTYLGRPEDVVYIEAEGTIYLEDKVTKELKDWRTEPLPD